MNSLRTVISNLKEAGQELQDHSPECVSTRGNQEKNVRLRPLIGSSKLIERKAQSFQSKAGQGFQNPSSGSPSSWRVIINQIRNKERCIVNLEKLGRGFKVILLAM